MANADIRYSVDEQQVINALKNMNIAQEEWEKGAVDANKKVADAIQGVADTLFKVHEKQKSALDRTTSSIERQAAAYGLPEWQRIALQRDQMIQKFGNEESAVRRLTEAYSPLIAKAKEAAEAAAKMEAAGAGGGGGFNVRYAFLGGKDLLEGRYKFALSEAANELVRMGGTALAIGGVAAVIGGVGFAAYETNKHLEEMRELPIKISSAFHTMNEEVVQHADQLRLENDQLANTIAKLEHRPENGFAVALDEARINADNLAKSLDKVFDAMDKALKANEIGVFDKFLGVQGTDDIKKWVEKYQSAVNAVNYAGSQNVHNAATPQAALAAQTEWDRALNAMRGSAQGKIGAWMADAQAPHIAGKGTIFQQDDSPERRAARLATLQGIGANLNMQADLAALQTKHGQLEGQAKGLQAEAESAKPMREFQKLMEQFANEMEKKVLNPVEEIFAKRDELLAKLPSAEMGGNYAQARDQANSYALPAASEELNKQVARLFVEDTRRAREYNEGMRHFWDQSSVIIKEAEKKAQEEAAKSARETAAANREIDTIHANGERGEVVAMAQHSMRLSQLGNLGGRPEDAIAAAYRERIGLAHQLRSIDEDRARKETDFNKQRVDMARAEADERREMFDAELERQTKLAELQRQQFDRIKSTASGLYETLFTHPTQFGSALAHTAQSTVVKHASDYLGGLTASALGPILGGNRTAPTVGGVPAVHVVNMPSGAGASPSFGGLSGWTGSTGGFPGGIGGVFGGDTVSMGYKPIPGPDGGISFPGAPGGTGGFAGPVSQGGAGGGFKSPGGIGGFKNMNWGGLTRADAGGLPGTDGKEGTDLGNSGRVTGVNGMAGAALSAGGMMLAQQGLLGSSRGTWGGVAEGTVGGAAIGFQMGGPIGAAIGAAAGFGIGIGEKLAGVESPQNEAKRLVQAQYHIGINTAMADGIVKLAQQKYGGAISIAVRSPEVRQMLGLYAAGTGQASKYPMSSTEAYGASLAESGGRLYQQAVSQYGNQYSYASSLPVLGGGSTGTLAGPTGNVQIALNVGGKDTANFMTGQYVTPDFVSSQYSAALQSSNARTWNSLDLSEPGSIFA